MGPELVIQAVLSLIAIIVIGEAMGYRVATLFLFVAYLMVL